MARPLRVLFVEDSEEDAELLALELRRGGYDPVQERVDTRADMGALVRAVFSELVADEAERARVELRLGDLPPPSWTRRCCGRCGRTCSRTR